MSIETINNVGMLYLIGFTVNFIWRIIRNGGIKAYMNLFREIVDEYPIAPIISIPVLMVVETLLLVSWPITMHLGIKNRLKSEKS